jgi:poly-gamma-glutamate synthesis protein (capsule biosynthesis protein)
MKKLKSFFILNICLFGVYAGNCEKITISALGDIMMHKEIQESAMYQTGNYDQVFSDVKEILQKDDFTIANLETPVADEIRISGAPKYNAKTSLVKSMKDAGIDFVSTANNHAFDQWAFGVRTTLKALEDNGIAYNGSGENKRVSESFTIVNVKSFSIGIMALTFSLNGLRPTREDYYSPYINYFPPNDEAALNEACEKIRLIKNKVDVVMILYHGGAYYLSEPSPIQTKWLKSFVEAGADVVLGTHSHMVQKVDFYKDSKENKNKLIAYSLGNFVPGLQSRYKYVKNPLEDIDNPFIKTSEGMILKFDIVRWNGKVEIINPRYVPLFTLVYYKTISPEKWLTYFQLMPIEKIIQLPDFDEERFKDLKPAKNIAFLRKEKMQKLLGIPEESISSVTVQK